MRNGDPLLPFWFILAMEGMNDKPQTARVKSWTKGLEINSSSVVKGNSPVANGERQGKTTLHHVLALWEGDLQKATS